MTIHKVIRYLFSCDKDRLGCWYDEYYTSEKKGLDEGWKLIKGELYCPYCASKIEANDNESKD